MPGGRRKGLNEAGGGVPCHFKSLTLQKAFEAMLSSSIADNTVPSNQMKLQKKTAHKNEPAPCIVNALPESIDSDKEKKIFTVEKASEIYVNNSKGTDVA